MKVIYKKTRWLFSLYLFLAAFLLIIPLVVGVMMMYYGIIIWLFGLISIGLVAMAWYEYHNKTQELIKYDDQVKCLLIHESIVLSIPGNIEKEKGFYKIYLRVILAAKTDEEAAYVSCANLVIIVLDNEMEKQVVIKNNKYIDELVFYINTLIRII